MIYKILNKLFGWDFIYWEFIFTNNNSECGVSRINVDKTGVVYFKRYLLSSIRDIIRRENDIPKNVQAETYLWLTCPKSKYFPEI